MAVNRFDFSCFANIMSTYFGSGYTNPEFVCKLFSSATNDQLCFKDPSLPQKLFSGIAPISSSVRKKFNSSLDKKGFVDFLSDCDLTDDAMDNLLNDLYIALDTDNILKTELELLQKKSPEYLYDFLTGLFREVVNRKDDRKVNRNKKSEKKETPVIVEEEILYVEGKVHNTELIAKIKSSIHELKRDEIKEVADYINSLYPRNAEKEPFGYDIYDELRNGFDKLFNENKNNDEPDPVADEELIAKSLELFKFQTSYALTRQGSEPYHFDNGEITSITDTPPEASLSGLHFTLINPPKVTTQIFEIVKIINPKVNRWFYFPKLLEYVDQNDENMNTIRTFFVDKPGPDGTAMVILNFDKNINCIHTNVGVLENDDVKLCVQPIPIKYNQFFEKAEFLANFFDLEPMKERAFHYSINIERIITIMDPDTGNIVKPVIYIEDGEMKAKIYLSPYKSYFAFEIGSSSDIIDQKEDDDPCTKIYGYSMTDSELGIAYKNGEYGLKTDYEKAIFYLQGEADKENPVAEFEIAGMYLNGQGFEQDIDKAIFWYRRSNLHGNFDAAYQLGILFYGKNYERCQFTKAFDYFMTAAKQNHKDSQYYIGIMYYDGDGVSKDYAKARKWFLKAAEQGDTDAQYYLGRIYYHGEGVKQNDSKAYEWYLKSAEQGDADAQNALGNAYCDGKGVEQDYNQALYWFEQAVENGSNSAINNMAWLYKHGYGVEQDYIKAFELFSCSAANGCIASYVHLGDLYYDGLGINKSIDKAVENYKTASDAGNERARLKLVEIYDNHDAAQAAQ